MGAGPLLATLQRRGQRGNALFEHRERIGMVIGTRQPLDFRRQKLDIVAQTRQRVVGGDIGDDGAERCDRTLEPLER